MGDVYLRRCAGCGAVVDWIHEASCCHRYPNNECCQQWVYAPNPTPASRYWEGTNGKPWPPSRVFCGVECSSTTLGSSYA